MGPATMASSKPQFESAIEFALSRAQEIEDVTSLPEPVRIVVLVHAAQGVIDNGGFQYFFESDFPGKPAYWLFVEAYRAIGADEAAATLEMAVALFPFAQPHRYVGKRNKFLDRFKDEEGDTDNSPFDPLTDLLCGNKTVWRQLRRYVAKNLKSLGG
jgi:hypothetical protein